MELKKELEQIKRDCDDRNIKWEKIATDYFILKDKFYSQHHPVINHIVEWEKNHEKDNLVIQKKAEKNEDSIREINLELVVIKTKLMFITSVAAFIGVLAGNLLKLFFK